MREFVSTEEIADILGLHKRMIQKIIREGRLNAIKIGKNYRVAKEDLEIFLVEAETMKLDRYDPLKNYLQSLEGEKIVLSMDDLERILKAKLPISAMKYRAWFGNDITHVQARAWLNAGWEVEAVTLGEKVSFVRQAKA